MNVYDFSNFPYREGVIGIVQRTDGKFLIVQMVNYDNHQWRFPGGGVNPGEKPPDALLRELKEELGSSEFTIIKASTRVNKYDWPDDVIRRQLLEKNRRFRGQEQTQYLVKFTGNPNKLVLDPMELRRIKWVTYPELKEHFVFAQQWELAEKVLHELLD